MKAKLLIVLLLATCLMGCGEMVGDVRIIPCEFNYTYDKTTRIIYVTHGHRLAPYYSENGKLCRYVDGKIVEVSE